MYLKFFLIFITIAISLNFSTQETVIVSGKATGIFDMPKLFFVLENKANSKYITKNQHNNYINSVKRKIMKLDLNINTKLEETTLVKEVFLYVARTKFQISGSFEDLNKIKDTLEKLSYIKEFKIVKGLDTYDEVLKQTTISAKINAQKRVEDRGQLEGFTVKDVVNVHLEKQETDQDGKKTINLTVYVTYEVERN